MLATSVPGQAGAAGLQDAVAQHVEAVDAVGVGRDHDRNAVLAGGGAGDVVQVEPRGIGVQLQQLAVLARRLENGVEIDFVALGGD